MAIVFDGPVTPDALTTFVREVPSPADQVLNTILPDRVLNRNTVDLSGLSHCVVPVRPGPHRMAGRLAALVGTGGRGV